MRNVIIHYHIFKNGGTSVDKLLKQNFGDSWRSFEGSSSSSILSYEVLAEFLESNPEVRAVSSHQVRPPLPYHFCNPIILLRHPIDRLRSVFEFVRKNPTQPNSEIARTRGLRGYVDWALESPEGGRAVLRDYQVMFLSGASFRKNHVANRLDLEHAKQLLKEWKVFGITRRFGESMALFNAAFKDSFPGLKLYALKANVSNPKYVSDAQEIERTKDELGEEIFSKILEKNVLDLELYEFAQKEFELALQRFQIY
jgi:hypothetical protein